MKSNDVKSNSYAEYDVDSNEKGPKFIIGSHARISKYKRKKKKKKIAEGCTPNWSEEVFVISKIKNIVPWTYFNLNGEEIIGTLYEK